MKLKYWGVESKKVEKKVGESPIEVKNDEEFEKLCEKIAGFDVRIAKLQNGIACANCGEVDNWAVQRTNEHLDGVCCNGCGIEVTNSDNQTPGVHDDELFVTQGDWDSIIFHDEVT